MSSRPSLRDRPRTRLSHWHQADLPEERDTAHVSSLPHSQPTEFGGKRRDERLEKQSTSQAFPGEVSDDEPQEPVQQPPSSPSPRPSSSSQEQSFNQSFNRTFQAALDNGLFIFIAFGVAAFAIGIPVGYFLRGDCGQGRFDQIDSTLNKFLTGTLKVNIDKALEDIKTGSINVINDQKTKLSTLHSSLGDSDTKLQDSASQISDSVYKLNQALKAMNSRMDSVETDVSNMKSKLTSVASEIENSQSKLGESTEAFVTRSKEVVSKIKETSNTNAQEIAQIASDTITQINAAASQYNNDLKTSADSIRAMIDNVDTKISDFQRAVSEVSTQRDKLTTVVTNTVTTGSDLQTVKTNLEGQVDKLKSLQEADGKTEAKQDYVGWGLDIFQIIMILMVYLAVTDSHKGNGGRLDATRGAMAARQVQRVIPGLGAGLETRRQAPTGPARHDVTVVTFTQETYDQARRVFPEMIGQAWPPAAKVEYKMLTGELDLSQIPSSRGYIVVIGYDARNSILEDMDGSMGSRKRQTIVGLQNTKRDVLVIYIDSDHQIEEPPDNTLYNTNLDRPTSHPILRPLVDAQRFMSLRHWRGTRLQADHIERWLRALR